MIKIIHRISQNTNKKFKLNNKKVLIKKVLNKSIRVI